MQYRNFPVKILSSLQRTRRLSSIPLGLDHSSSNTPGVFNVKTFNKISPVGLGNFPGEHFKVSGDFQEHDNVHAILLRSHKLSMDEIPASTRCIARCGSGTNNIPVAELTVAGIPVFNTPGANANAVKELVLCGLFLASRDIVGGINHMRALGQAGTARERVEKDKAMFGGREIAGKTLGVIGLGNIGCYTANNAAALGMKVVGYDPGMTIQSALKLPADVRLLNNMKDVFRQSDYISLNIPYINKPPIDGGTAGIVNAELLQFMKPTASLLNFARGELVDSKALKEFMNQSDNSSKYVTDFPDDELWDHERTIVLPHLGASTEEAEDGAAAMAVDTVVRYLTTGEIINSVNFPETLLDIVDPDKTVRVSLVNENTSGVLSKVLSVFSEHELNIVQQVNKSRGDIAYNVIDVDIADGVHWNNVQRSLTSLPGVKSSRFIYGSSPLGGYGYAKNVPGSGYKVM